MARLHTPLSHTCEDPPRAGAAARQEGQTCRTHTVLVTNNINVRRPTAGCHVVGAVGFLGEAHLHGRTTCAPSPDKLMKVPCRIWATRGSALPRTLTPACMAPRVPGTDWRELPHACLNGAHVEYFGQSGSTSPSSSGFPGSSEARPEFMVRSSCVPRHAGDAADVVLPVVPHGRARHRRQRPRGRRPRPRRCGRGATSRSAVPGVWRPYCRRCCGAPRHLAPRCCRDLHDIQVPPPPVTLIPRLHPPL